MMNPIEPSGAILNAGAPTSAASGVPVADVPGVGALGDLVAPTAAGMIALAYANAVAPGRFGGVAGAAADAAYDDELERRYGSQLALVRAALPTEMQAQFSAQLVVASGLPPGGDPAAEEGNAWMADDDVGALVHAAVLGNDAASVSRSASRLARYVAAHGAGPVAAALQLAGSPFVFATAATTPQATHDERRITRREDEPPRRRRESPDASGAASQPEGEAAETEPGYTIDDIVRFADITVAIHRQDVRSFPWPS